MTCTNTKTILTVTISSVLVLGMIGAPMLAFGQYLGNVGIDGKTGANTLEEVLKIKRAQVELAEQVVYSHTHTPGSGQIPLPPTNNVGLILIIGIVVGTSTGAILIKSRKGKYADMNNADNHKKTLN